jgi:hypothetical protein
MGASSVLIEQKPLLPMRLPSSLFLIHCMESLMKSFEEMTEAAKHRRYIEALADEVHQPIERVEPVYDDIYSHLKETADIKDYVPVFAWRRTRALLTHT